MADFHEKSMQKTRVNFYMNFYTQILVYFYGDWLCL